MHVGMNYLEELRKAKKALDKEHSRYDWDIYFMDVTITYYVIICCRRVVLISIKQVLDKCDSIPKLLSYTDK
jgi:hypothetical protein